ncbi:9666_t:CDS:1, partial [Funneliformis caledonium]
PLDPNDDENVDLQLRQTRTKEENPMENLWPRQRRQQVEN